MRDSLLSVKMGRPPLFRCFFISALVILSFWAPLVYAFEVKAEPSSINPGDAFLLRISGLKGLAQPEAVFLGRPISIAPCGDGCYFGIGATDSKASPGNHMMQVRVGMTERSLQITVRPHIFPETHLTLPAGKVTLSEEDGERAAQEERLLKSLWPRHSAKMWEGNFSMPLGNEISTQYGVRRIMNKTKESIHGGIDIRGREGEDVRASNSGKVVLAEELFFGGNTLVIDHGMGIFSVYMHLSGFSRITGEEVSKGDVIGFVGSTGRSTGPHLHFGIKAQELNVNPVSFVKLKL